MASAKRSCAWRTSAARRSLSCSSSLSRSCTRISSRCACSRTLPAEIVSIRKIEVTMMVQPTKSPCP
jgi:hypothetical protein